MAEQPAWHFLSRWHVTEWTRNHLVPPAGFEPARHEIRGFDTPIASRRGEKRGMPGDGLRWPGSPGRIDADHHIVVATGGAASRHRIPGAQALNADPGPADGIDGLLRAQSMPALTVVIPAVDL